jgi:hypothetical protein
MDLIGVTCLSLTSKFFALHCLAATATFPSKRGYRYLEDTRHLKFLNLLQNWVPKEYRMCYICRVYRPINGGHIKDIFEEIHGYKWNALEKRNETHITKKVLRLHLWKDEDWTFISIGKGVSTHGKTETRTYCPACIREVVTIKIGRKSRKMWNGLEAAKPPPARQCALPEANNSAMENSSNADRRLFGVASDDGEPPAGDCTGTG